jgi:hypothetical protein
VISNFAGHCNIETSMGKIFQIFFVKFNFFKYLKFNKFYFKKYIYNVIKIPNYFSHVLYQMLYWTAKFEIQSFYTVRDIKKISCLREEKRASTDLDAPINGLDRRV